MEILKGVYTAIVSLLATILVVLIVPAYGQNTASCTSSMVTSFSPCLNYITGSINGRSPPPADCCSALASLLSSNVDCSCLLLSGSLPFSLPGNLPVSLPGNLLVNLPATPLLGLSLPSICGLGSASSLQCKASAPPPVPVSSGSDTTSPSVLPLAPAVTPTAAIPVKQGLRPLVIPSSAVKLQRRCSLFLVLIVLGAMLLIKS